MISYHAQPVHVFWKEPWFIRADPAPISGAAALAILGNCATPASANLSTVTVQVWVSEPPVRGTWTLVYSCVFTIGLCIWEALHLNVPVHGGGQIQLLLHKAVIAIFGPEVVLAMALLQLNRAWKLRKFSKSLSKNARASHETLGDAENGLGTIEPATMVMNVPALVDCRRLWSNQAPREWSWPSCFYVVVGGLVVDSSNIKRELPRSTLARIDGSIWDRQWLTLTEDAI